VLPLGGLGRYILDAIPSLDYSEMLAASILVTVLALVADGVFAITQRLVVPRGVVAGRVQEVRVRTIRSRPGAGSNLPDHQTS
jgi:osmoprotectant transport system permease protein